VARQVNGDGALELGLMEDQFVTTTAAYHTTATTSASSWWIMQMIALPLAGGGGTNAQALTAPTGLTATVASNSEIDLSWTGSTDNIGVTGYLIERCGGGACTNFVQIASVPPALTTYNDSGLAPSATYTYRVRATDMATLEGAYSVAATASTATAATISH
jgi:Fibronectin type III domain